MTRVGGWRARLAVVAGAWVVTAAAVAAPSAIPAPAGVAARATAGTEAGAAAAAARRVVAPAGSSPVLGLLPPDAIADPAPLPLAGARPGAPGREPPEQPSFVLAPSFRLVARPVVPAVTDGLDVATAAVYTVDPKAHVVRVAVDITAVNRLPVTPGARYYYPGLNLAVQPEATQFVAVEGGARDATTTQAKSGFRLLSVSFASRLYVGQTAHLHLSYVLPAGAPRSQSQVRVGAAYTAFVVWAFGDRGTVEADLPAGYTVAVTGGSLDEATGANGEHVLTGTTSDPGAWYAWIDARDDAALTSRLLQLPGGEQVVVHAWPEDTTWERRVAQTLTTGIPALEQRIGLPWPVQGQLSVIEVASSVLEGYAGFYSPSNQQITISEQLDPLTIVHEASHAWFNSSLFSERWINEGLADEYAYRTLRGLGVTVSGPPKVRTTDAAAFALNTWGPPQPIKTRTQDAHEQWGYDASWTVVRKVVGAVGEPGMAKVFAAASAGTTAYPGSGPAEKSHQSPDWRRFLDLAEEVGGGKGIAAIIGPWALTSADQATLTVRAAARTAYHTLVARGGGWAAPTVVRMDLEAWDFAAATDAMTTATGVLNARDAVRAAAAPQHLALPARIQTAYQDATTPDALAKDAADEQALRQALGAITSADAADSAPRDWLVELGLVGQDPGADLAAARAAWAAGDTATAAAKAASVTAAFAVAADAGRLRLVAIAAGILAVLLLVILAIAVVRRRAGRRRRPPAGPPLASSGGPGAIGATPDAGDSGPTPDAGLLAFAGLPAGHAGGDPGAPPGGPFAPGGDWIDPALAPPAPPAWWRPGMPPTPPAGLGSYPILPPSAPGRTTSGPPPGPRDEGAQ